MDLQKYVISFYATTVGFQAVEQSLAKMGITTQKAIANMQSAFSGLDSLHQKINANVGQVAKTMSTSVAFMANKQGDSLRKTSTLWQDVNGKMWETSFTSAKVGQSWNVLDNTIKVVPKSLKQVTNAGSQAINMLMRSALVVPIWFAIRQAFMGFIGLVQSSIRFLIDWEYQMAQVRIVSMGTAEEYAVLSQRLLQLASAYGTSTKDLGEGTKLWAQQGKTIAEIIPLMETTIRMSMLTGRSVSESVEDLTAIMKSYKIEANETSQVVDKIVKVELQHAITTEVLVGALKQVAPVAEQFGISFERLLGIITATHVATRSTGPAIGRAWRTIFSRMGTVAVDAIQNLAKVPLFLDEMGKATFEHTNTFRNFETVLEEVAIATSTLGTAQQAQLRQAIAGVRQGAEWTAFLQNYQEGLDATIESLNAYGQGQRATNILLDTTTKRADQLRAQWNLFMSEIADTGAIKGAISGLTGFIDYLRNITVLIQKGVGGLRALTGIDVGREERQKTLELITGEVTKTQDLIKQTQLLSRFVEIRNRLESQGLTERVKKTDEFIQKFKDAFSNIPGFENILTVPVENLISFLDTKQEELGGHLFGEKAKAKVLSDIDKLSEDIIVKWKTALQQLESPARKGGTAEIVANQLKNIIPTDASIAQLEKMKKRLEDIVTGKGIIAKGERFFLSQKEEERMKNSLVLLDDILKIKKQVAEISSGATLQSEITKLQVQAETEQKIAEISELTQEKLKEQLDQFKNLEEVGYSRLQIAQKELDFIKANADAMDEFDAKAQRKLELEIQNLQVQERYRNFQDDITLTEERMQLEGYTQLQIEMERLALLQKIGAGEEAIYNQRKKVQQVAVQELQARQQLLTNIFLEYEKGGAQEREALKRVLELIQLKPEDLASHFKTDFLDKKLIIQYWNDFSEEGKKAIAEVIGEEYNLPGTDILGDRLDIKSQIKDAFDINIAEAFATTWETSMMSALNRFKESFLEIVKSTKQLEEEAGMIPPPKVGEPIRKTSEGIYTNLPDYGFAFDAMQQPQQTKRHWFEDMTEAQKAQYLKTQMAEAQGRMLKEKMVKEQKENTLNVTIGDIKVEVTPNQAGDKVVDEVVNQINNKRSEIRKAIDDAIEEF
jgi:TP901 family phage tail tape measure protein